jgi:hypothetical protein
LDLLPKLNQPEIMKICGRHRFIPARVSLTHPQQIAAHESASGDTDASPTSSATKEKSHPPLPMR